MAGITFMATADEGTTARWSSVTGPTLSSTQARTGTYSYRLGSGGKLNRVVASSATCPYVRAALFATSALIARIRFLESTTLHLVIQLDFTAGTVSVLKNTTVLATYSAGLALNTWYCVECAGTIHDTTGTSTVKLNGETIAALTLTDKDTQNGGTGVCDNVEVYAAGDNYLYVDDVCFRDDALPGVGGVYLGTVNAEATAGVKEWAASAGDPNECVDEIPATMTDYISRATTEEDDQHEFEHAGIEDLTYASIAGIGVIALAQLSDGTGSAAVSYYDPTKAAGEQGVDVTLSTSPGYIDAYWIDDSEAAAWTEVIVNRLYIGVTVGAVPA